MHTPTDPEESDSDHEITNDANAEDGATPVNTANSLPRRTFLWGVAASGIGALGAGAISGTAAAAPSETSWELAAVPYGLDTPWTEEVGPDNAHPEYPRPQMVREEWKTLNGVWQFEAAEGGDAAPTDEDLDEEILVPYPVESALSGIKRHEDRMWYRRTFTVPNSWLVPTAHPGKGVGNNPNSQRLLLHFERADWEARVFVNGEEVTTHRGGYDSFTVDVTDALVADGEQEIVVGVYDPTDTGTQPVGKQEIAQDEDIFFTPCSGIWESVWLEPVPETHIDGVDMTPDIDEEVLRITVEASNAEGATVEATAFDGEESVGSVAGPANEELELLVPDPHLWSPDDPFLYNLDVTLRRRTGNGRDNRRGEGRGNGGKPLDSVKSYFGMRSVDVKSIRGVPRPTLNGDFVVQNGIYDQGYWPDGIYTAPTDEALRFDLQLAKDLGYNTYRKHIKIPSKRWYYHADRLGLLVWQDIPNQPLGQPVRNENAQEQFRTELREMVTENDAHPSLAVWIPVNEGWGHGKNNYDRIRSTTRFVRDLDDERIIDALSGIDTMFSEGTVNGDVIDYHNYAGLTPIPEPTDTQYAAVGESSAGWTPIDGHQWDDGNPTGGTPEQLVENLRTRAENIEEYMLEDDLSAAINLQTTDTEFHYQGVVTYDRQVVKPELVSEDAISRIRAANHALIERSKQVEQGPYLTVEAPLSYSPGDPFEVAGTFTNPEREASGSFDVTDVSLSVTGLPDGVTATATTDTAFVTVGEGASVTARWQLETDSESASDPGIYEFAVEATFDGADGTTTVREADGFEIEAAEPRLVGSWPFDEGSGDTTADVAGDNDGTLVGGPTWTEGRIDDALEFDGTDDYVDTSANVLDTTRDYSVAAWVRLNDRNGFQTAISQVMGDGTAFFLQYLGSEGQFSFSFFGGRAFGGPTVEAGRWYHLAGVHDTYEGRAKLYVDGERVAAIDREPTASSGDLLVGHATVGGNPVDFWNGTIDEVRAYQSSLDDEEVRALYEAGN